MITVFHSGSEYYASRTSPENMPNFAPPGVIFSVVGDIGLGDGSVELRTLEESARTEARKRGIAYVTNLD